MRRRIAMLLCMALIMGACQAAAAEDMPVFEWADAPEPVASVAPPEIRFEGADMMVGDVSCLSGDGVLVCWRADGDVRGYRVEIADGSGEIVKQIDTTDTQYSINVGALSMDQSYTFAVTTIPVNGTAAEGARALARFTRLAASTPEPTPEPAPEPTPTPTPTPEPVVVSAQAKTIRSIVANDIATYGLKTDGTVVCTYKEAEDYCAALSKEAGIVGLYGYGIDFYVVGVTYDGRVIAPQDEELEAWRDIVMVSGDLYHNVGLKTDGTVIAVGRTDEGQCDVGDRRDIRTY